MVAAIALAPMAAMSLQASQAQTAAQNSILELLSAASQEIGQQFSLARDVVKQRVDAFLSTERGKELAKKVDEALMYMEWTYEWLGLDLRYCWDPELYHLWKTNPSAFANRLADKIVYYEELPAPPLHDMRLSYSKFLQLLHSHQIKRVIVLGDMKTAVVEIPQPGYASNLGAPMDFGTPANGGANLLANPEALNDPTQWFAPELPEWDMEKYRFYVDLPGDFWEQGVLLRYLKERTPRVVFDPETRQYVLPYKYLTKVGEVRTELTLLDPRDSWEFASYMLTEANLESLLGVVMLVLGGRIILLLEDIWYKFIGPVVDEVVYLCSEAWEEFNRRRKKKKQKPEESLMDVMGRSKARLFNVDKEGKEGKRTGVTFDDVAGLDQIVFELREITRLLLKEEQFVQLGAKAPRGVLFQGPPGTGKTYLARAMAGEAGVPFLTCNGAEFVEMFQGVAQLRVQNLYNTAREYAPCIIFIDEIDAIGKSRSYNSDDPGAQERELALLEMLVQLDGIDGGLESVLTIGATNMVDELDAALLRPGRFDIIFNIGTPSPATRLAILMYHAKNKPFDPGELYPIMRKVAHVTDSWSAASLANLLNEAAIISVRKSMERITLPLMLEIIDNYEHGEEVPRLPAGEGKNRLALTTAAKAVAYALTPGCDAIKFATVWPTKEYLSAVQFKFSLVDNPDKSVTNFQTDFKTNAVYVGEHHLGEFYHLSLLLLPLYAERAAELVFLGPDAATTSSAASLSDAFEIAYYCARNSMLHPRFSSMPPIHHYMYFGQDKAVPDPLTQNLDLELNYHKLAITLLKAAWQRTLRMVMQRRTTIVRVAEEMLADDRDLILGDRLVEIVETTPLDDDGGVQVDSDFLKVVDAVMGAMPGVVRVAVEEDGRADYDVYAAGKVADVSFRTGAGSMGQVGFSQPGQGEPLLKIRREDVETVARAVMGRLDMADLVGRRTSEEVAQRVRDRLLDPQTTERLKAIRKFVQSASQSSEDFPPPPDLSGLNTPIYGAVEVPLEFWKQRKINRITWSAAEMLYSPRQMEAYRADMDMPMYANETNEREDREREAKPVLVLPAPVEGEGEAEV